MKRLFVFIAALCPFIVYLSLALLNRLGVNPIDELIEKTGFIAMLMLFFVLLLPWLKTIGLNLLSYRRMLGLYAFFYATLHLMLVFIYEFALELTIFWSEVSDKPFIWLGLLAWLVLLPLALTSTGFSQRLLKKKWKKLHQIVYIGLTFVVIHYGLQLRGELLNYLFLAVGISFIAYSKITRSKFLKKSD